MKGETRDFILRICHHAGKWLIFEVFLIFMVIFTVNNYVGNVDTRITADGIGYYDYLPAVFIHNDLVRYNKPATDSLLYQRINNQAAYVTYNQYKVNKYPVGTAVLQWPFFFAAYLTTPNDGNLNDGYQEPYQKAAFYSVLFYLFLSMVFFKKLLLLYQLKTISIRIGQLLMVFSTPILNYVNFDGAFSHVYSLFAITAFSFYAKSYFDENQRSHLFKAAVFLGLVIILRQINIITLAALPFLAGSPDSLKRGFLSFIKKPTLIAVSLMLVVSVFSIQSIVWFLQTGTFLLYSYQGESFNFDNPMFLSILFSYKKGLFVYTPIMAMAIISTIIFMVRKQYFHFITFLSFFAFLTYVLSSWSAWFYGCSYGLRAYIDFMGLLIIPLLLLVNRLSKYQLIPIVLLFAATVHLNLIQTYQYKEFILHWVNMDKTKYWKVFLKTDEQYKGWIWKTDAPIGKYKLLTDTLITIPLIKADTSVNVFSLHETKKLSFQNLRNIRLSYNDIFSSSRRARIGVTIKDAGDSTVYYHHSPYFLHFTSEESDSVQHGFFDFIIDTRLPAAKKELIISIYTEDIPISINSLHMKLYKYRWE